jgi:hypothetical protein
MLLLTTPDPQENPYDREHTACLVHQDKIEECALIKSHYSKALFPQTEMTAAPSPMK